MEKTLQSTAGRLGALALTSLLAVPMAAQAVPLTNGGLLNSFETTKAGDPFWTEGWVGLAWGDPVAWDPSSDAATDGTKSLKATYTNPEGGNFNWGVRFESHDANYNLLTPEEEDAWEAPWREALADNPANYSLSFDVIYNLKTDTRPGIPNTPTWANVAVAMDWDSPAESGGPSGWTQWGSLGNVWADHDQSATVKIPLNTIIGGSNAKPLPADFWWIQLTLGTNGGWNPGQEATFYFDNIRITQDVLPAVPGDADGDGDVDLDDQGIWASNFTGSLGSGTGTSTFGQGDFDGDKDVDLDDQGIWASNFTGSLAPVALAAVPEPTALAGCGLVLPLLARRRRA